MVGLKGNPMRVEFQKDGKAIDPPEVVHVVAGDIQWMADAWEEKGHLDAAKAIRQLVPGEYRKGTPDFDAALLAAFGRGSRVYATVVA